MEINHEAGGKAYFVITWTDFLLLMLLESEVMVQGIGECLYILLPPNEHPNPLIHPLRHKRKPIRASGSASASQPPQ